MAAIRVLVNGALGKMGQTVMAGLAREPDMAIAAGADIGATSDRVAVPGTAQTVPLGKRVDGLVPGCGASVLVDFSTADAALPAVRSATMHGLHFVVGTTGLKAEWVDEMEALARKYGVGGVVAPNFALGAVLLMHLAQKAAPYFEHAEIMEMHHETKIDAPSGTAAATAHLMAQARGRPFERNVPQVEAVAGTRAGAVEGVTIHSLRLPGAMAHQEVIFGLAGQTLSIRHDTINRDCYIPGIAMAVRHVVAHKGLVRGLDKLMGLS